LNSSDVLKILEDKARAAYEVASRFGEVIGYVSRTSPSLINEEGGYVVFDVDPVIYFSNFNAIAQAGSYLGVVDIKTLNLISLRVVSVERRDVLAELDLPDMYMPLPQAEVSGLMTKTRVKAKPLLAFNVETGEVVAANYVIEPQSPVVLLKDPRLIQAILGLPSEGVFLGYATVGDMPVFGGNAPLLLPLKAFYQHVLVVGTTGSGKTTLLKNIIAAMYNGFRLQEKLISVVIVDPNKDYVVLPLRPLWKLQGAGAVVSENEKALAEKAWEQAPGIKGVVVILPVTRSAVEGYVEKAETWARVLKMLAEDYIRSVISPIAGKFGWSYRICELEVVEEPAERGVLRYVKASIEVDYGVEKDTIYYYIVPYALRFTDFKPKELISLNPYFTRQAKDALLRLMQALIAKNAYLETVYDLYEALKEARYRIEEKTRPRGVVLDPNKEYVVEIVKDLAIHKSTLENMIRQIAAITDTGIFDVYVKGYEDKYLREPPIEKILEKHSELFNGYPIVIDLEYLQIHSQADPEKTISIVAFRILNRIFEWKLVQSRLRFETQPVLIFIDEAHRFFPSRSGVEEYLEHVSSMVDRIARLGRARKLGLVFSTHSPKDVHDIILQLTNTKIVLRTDKTHLSSLDLPEEYRDFITRASDRVGVVKSHVLRLGYASFKTPLPLLGHYDLSALF
jgi:DNA helicase HerA-like ATPase